MELTGAFIQPLRMLLRQTQINVVSPPCVSWVSIPRGSEKGSWGVARGKAPVNLDKREQPCPVDKLSTRECSDACASPKFEKELENTNTNSPTAPLIARAGALVPQQEMKCQTLSL